MNFLSNLVLTIVDFFYGLTNSYGISIILLTILVRLALLPLNLKSMKFAHLTKIIQPEMQSIQKKYKNDQEKLNKAVMEVYQKYKINPAAGCLPLFIQFPILIAVINALKSPEFFKVAEPFFLGINLKLPEMGGKAWTLGIKYLILPILAVVTTYLQTKVTAAGNTQASMKSMTLFMTAMIGWMTLMYPSGLALYWVSGTIFTIFVYIIFNRIMDGRDFSPVEGVKDSEEKRNKKR